VLYIYENINFPGDRAFAKNRVLTTYMKRPLLKQFLLLLICLCTGIVVAKAQTCNIVNNDTIICQGTSVSFSLNTTGGTPTSYAWNFGNGFTAITASPAHTYTSSGTFVPTVTVTFAGGATCTATAKQIRVFSTPNASFSITTSREMCFKDNKMCILDLSTAGTSKAPIKQRVFQLSNGFLQIDYPPFGSQICYKDSTDPQGHLFSLVMEVTDTNNCVSKFQKKDSVLLYRKFEDLDYKVQINQLCRRTIATFTNTSLMPRSRVAKFVWQFGDGTFDSVNWVQTTHTYTGNGMYQPILIVKDTQSCVDTVKAKEDIWVAFPDSAILMLHSSTQCYKGNAFECMSMNVPQFSFDWKITDISNNPVPFTAGQPNHIFFTTPACGQYKVSLKLSLGGCIVQTDSFINVLGPKAVMERGKDVITNGKQCNIRDTVYFVTPNPYLSCVYKNGLGLKHLWNFDDAFAPQCTVDTRKGINTGMNCNFSRDSAIVNHVYTPGKEKCYYPSLYMVDTIHGCSDSTHAKIPLMHPDAAPAPNAVPPRRGLTVADSLRCFGEVVSFSFDILPSCGYSRAYINIDSACGANNWLLTDTIGSNVYSHVYKSTCSNTGYVTIGLIIANGYDQAGNICYDTAWYHHVLRLSPIEPKYTMKVESGCKPYKVTFIPVDSIQYNLRTAFWALNAGSVSISDSVTQFFTGTDSVVYSRSAIYPTGGVYNSYTLFTNDISCFGTHFLRFALGFHANFTTTKSVICLQDSVRLGADVFYWSAIYPNDRHPVNFWGMPARAAAGKETVKWDIGDGNGFVYSGDTVNVKFPSPGRYTVKMLVTDSTGCTDTIVKSDYITVTAPDAHIAVINQLYYCAPQIVLFNDSSLIYDQIPFTTPSTLDTIISWRWDFGDYTLPSYLKDAGHNYTSNGTFNVRLIVGTMAGCTDTGYAEVSIAGPAPSFTIDDTLGCAPFTVLFDNTTGQPLKSWTWYFGDSTNQTFTTLNDSSVQFTYKKPGVYYIRLLGSQDVTNPTTGSTTNCNSFFPDPFTKLPERKVIVLPTPPVSLAFIDSACVGQELDLNSHSDTSYTRLAWRISNGDIVTLDKPDSTSHYQFDSTGTYNIMLIGIQNPVSQCMDTAIGSIRIINVGAEFDIDSSKSPTFSFINKSSGAVRYQWNFGKPDLGVKNESDQTNAECYLGPDTGTYSVCLMAFNELDCMDSICKSVHIHQQRLIIPNVFTPGSDDGYNDAFDIDIVGYTEYHLLIYNRWGTKVFEGLKDGYKNDGINWNGNDHQTGPPCADGTYYYIFTYKFYTESKSSTAHGTVTLIRNK
jgi:PKD repeat protein